MLMMLQITINKKDFPRVGLDRVPHGTRCRVRWHTKPTSNRLRHGPSPLTRRHFVLLCREAAIACVRIVGDQMRKSRKRETEDAPPDTNATYVEDQV
jgi:hypothetical protein